METNALFYRIQEGVVTVDDYILWSQTLLKNDVSSTSLSVISSLPSNNNMFEVEDYFKRALKELDIEIPKIEKSSRAYISLLATQILIKEDDNEMFHLAHEIFRIVSNLHYPDDLMEWYYINEMIDQIKYDKSSIKFNEEDIKSKIKEEAKLLLDSLTR